MAINARKDELETVTLQTLETYFYIFGTHVFQFVFPRIIAEPHTCRNPSTAFLFRAEKRNKHAWTLSEHNWPAIWKNGGFLTFLSQKSRSASAGILVSSNNYSIEITSCTYTLLVLQFSQHFLNYKNRFEVLVSLAAWKEIAFGSPLLSWSG